MKNDPREISTMSSKKIIKMLYFLIATATDMMHIDDIITEFDEIVNKNH